MAFRSLQGIPPVTLAYLLGGVTRNIECQSDAGSLLLDSSGNHLSGTIYRMLSNWVLFDPQGRKTIADPSSSRVGGIMGGTIREASRDTFYAHHLHFRYPSAARGLNSSW